MFRPPGDHTCAYVQCGSSLTGSSRHQHPSRYTDISAADAPASICARVRCRRHMPQETVLQRVILQQTHASAAGLTWSCRLGRCCPSDGSPSCCSRWCGSHSAPDCCSACDAARTRRLGACRTRQGWLPCRTTHPGTLHRLGHTGVQWRGSLSKPRPLHLTWHSSTRLNNSFVGHSLPVARLLWTGPSDLSMQPMLTAPQAGQAPVQDADA